MAWTPRADVLQFRGLLESSARPSAIGQLSRPVDRSSDRKLSPVTGQQRRAASVAVGQRETPPVRDRYPGLTEAASARELSGSGCRPGAEALAILLAVSIEWMQGESLAAHVR